MTKQEREAFDALREALRCAYAEKHSSAAFRQAREQARAALAKAEALDVEVSK